MSRTPPHIGIRSRFLLLAAALMACAVGARSAASETKRRPNRLIREKSPYLLRHAPNRVDWFPWGKEAFDRARHEKKPIFLSIGYSSCHWCHVMERESYDEPRIASILNENFIAIKVDREERPDIDHVYMSAVVGMGGGVGWPLNVFLTPKLEPFYGGTYFPPERRWGRPGFADVLRGVSRVWRKNPSAVRSGAQRSMEDLRRRVESGTASVMKLDARWLASGYLDLKNDFDAQNGGGPRFPMPVNQDFLLRYYARSGDTAPLDLAASTLRAMAAGGLYDQVGGGFHRYSTDALWRVPHFEKMLSDNAQLAVNYLEAFQVTRDPELARVARETLDYALRDLANADGAFCAAESADSLPRAEANAVQREGVFYLWTESEIKKLLGQASGLFIDRYGVQEAGNAPVDPRGEFAGMNILYAARSVEAAAKRAGSSAEEARRALDAARRTLLAARAKRPRPERDETVLASWNGLMVSALAKGAQILDEPRYAEAAARAGRFLRAEMYEADAKTLRRLWRAGRSVVPGMASDYAFLIQGLLDLYETDFDPTWLEWALELTETQDRLFMSPEGGLFMTASASDPHLPVRPFEDFDDSEPSASSVAALNWLRLDQYIDGRMAFRRSAERALERLGERMKTAPRSLPRMLVALDFALSKPRRIIIAGKPKAPDTQAMLRALHRRFIPVKTVMLVDDAGPLKRRLLPLAPSIRWIAPIKGQATAYVCVDSGCELPTTSLSEFERLLDLSVRLTDR